MRSGCRSTRARPPRPEELDEVFALLTLRPRACGPPARPQSPAGGHAGVHGSACARGRRSEWTLTWRASATPSATSTTVPARRERARLDLLLPRAAVGLARRLPGALPVRAPARARADGRERPRGRACTPRTAPASGRVRSRRRRRCSSGRRACATTTCAVRRSGSPRSCGTPACATTPASGWPSLPGLRSGTPYPYRLWDPERREPGGWELPLAVMDATLAEERYLGLVASPAALERLRPRVSAALAWIDERGGWTGTAAEMLDRWEARPS